MLTATFTWLDYSEQQRRRMLDVVSMFSESDTVDELGLSYARDGIADLLFPGTSSVQRGARYFLFIPWIYRKLESRRRSSGEIQSKARAAEVELIHALLASGEYTGVIGADKKDKLKRLASNIYWQGLRSWGICLFEGSQEQYHRSLDGFYEKVRRFQETRDDDGDVVEGVPANWHRGLPNPPEGFPDGVRLVLTKPEGVYLRDRILNAHPRSMLAVLANRDRTLPTCDYPWQVDGISDFPEKIRVVLRHAANFSDVMHGAALLYNLLVAEKVPRPDWADHYKTEIDKWANRICPRVAELQNWDVEQVWRLAEEGGHRAPQSAREFVLNWVRLVLTTSNASSLSDHQYARRLVADREIKLKKSMARVINAAARDRWNGASGAASLSYRWQNAQVIVGDILKAILGAEHA